MCVRSKVDPTPAIGVICLFVCPVDLLGVGYNVDHTEAIVVICCVF